MSKYIVVYLWTFTFYTQTWIRFCWQEKTDDLYWSFRPGSPPWKWWKWRIGGGGGVTPPLRHLSDNGNISISYRQPSLERCLVTNMSGAPPPIINSKLMQGLLLASSWRHHSFPGTFPFCRFSFSFPPTCKCNPPRWEFPLPEWY